MITFAGAAFAAAAIVLPHSPADLRELVLRTGVAAPVIALGAWIVPTPATFSGTVLAAASGLALGAVGGAALSVAGAVHGGLAAFALARTAGRTNVQASLIRRPRLEKVHSLLERRGFLAMVAARLVPGGPPPALPRRRRVPRRNPCVVAAMTIGAILRTAPYAVLGVGIGSGSLATILIARASIALGGLAAAVPVRRLRIPVAAT